MSEAELMPADFDQQLQAAATPAGPVVARSFAPAQAAPMVMTPAHMLQIAVERGADLDQLQKFMDLNDRYQAGEARKAYVAAMARFKANPPEIIKSKLVSYGNTSYRHALLSDVCSAAIKGLADVGISHSWDITQNASLITVSCILTHEQGHSERVTMTAGADTSGQKNAIQAIASAVSYLERYTLLAATGLAAQEQTDDDGRAAGGGNAPPLPDKPDGYDRWKADMVALADEGLKAMQECWKRTSPDLRQYASMSDAAWLKAIREVAERNTVTK